MSVLKVAFLQMCPHCRLHGHIALPDGTKSDPILTRKFAFDEVAKLLKQKRIDGAEALFLREQINSSDLLYDGNAMSWTFRVDEAVANLPPNCGSLLDEVELPTGARMH